MPAFCLNIHAAYRCRHAGACCEADWHIPVEPAVVALVEAGGLLPAGGKAFVSGRDGGDITLARTAGGACVFFNGSTDRRCRIHQHAGVAALPSACRHFPRVILNDDRGTFIAMSHFCPTAAAMLAHQPGPVEVERAPASLEVEAAEGLEARGALPPLLRPGVLMDLAAYDAWERAGIRVLGDPDVPLDRSMGILVEATEQIRTWTPGSGPLVECVSRAFDDAGAGSAMMPMADPERQAWLRVVRDVTGRAPAREATSSRPTATAGRHPSPVPLQPMDAGAPASVLMSRYIAARLFGNHLAYEGRGLRSIVAWLRTCLAVLQDEIAARGRTPGERPSAEDLVPALRAADLILMHELDSAAFARRVARMEE